MTQTRRATRVCRRSAVRGVVRRVVRRCLGSPRRRPIPCVKTCWRLGDTRTSTCALLAARRSRPPLPAPFGRTALAIIRGSPAWRRRRAPRCLGVEYRRNCFGAQGQSHRRTCAGQFFGTDRSALAVPGPSPGDARCGDVSCCATVAPRNLVPPGSRRLRIDGRRSACRLRIVWAPPSRAIVEEQPHKSDGHKTSAPTHTHMHETEVMHGVFVDGSTAGR